MKKRKKQNKPKFAIVKYREHDSPRGPKPGWRGRVSGQRVNYGTVPVTPLLSVVQYTSDVCILQK